MTVNTTINGDELIVRVEGKLDCNTSPELEETIRGSLKEISHITFDFEKLYYISSSGIRILLASVMLMKRKSGSVKVINLCDFVREILDITGIIDFLDT